MKFKDIKVGQHFKLSMYASGIFIKVNNFNNANALSKTNTQCNSLYEYIDNRLYPYTMLPELYVYLVKN